MLAKNEITVMKRSQTFFTVFKLTNVIWSSKVKDKYKGIQPLHCFKLTPHNGLLGWNWRHILLEMFFLRHNILYLHISQCCQLLSLTNSSHINHIQGRNYSWLFYFKHKFVFVDIIHLRSNCVCAKSST